MFNISAKPRLARRVPLSIETENGREDHSFLATFEIADLSKSSIERMQDDATQVAFLCEVIKDLGDIAGEDGALVPFSPDLLSLVISRVDCRIALIRAYFAAMQEVAKDTGGRPKPAAARVRLSHRRR